VAEQRSRPCSDECHSRVDDALAGCYGMELYATPVRNADALNLVMLHRINNGDAGHGNETAAF
jgi:hypothetical protein